MTTLVTGASGLIGRFVMRELMLRGEEAVGLDRAPPVRLRDGEVFVKADITDPLRWVEVLETHRPDRIIHLAAMVAHNSQAAPLDALRINVMGTAYLFEAARLIGKPRIVYTSTVGVYGAPDLYDAPVDETAPIAPGLVYAGTKAMNEVTANHYAKVHDLALIGIRPLMAFGPGRYEGALGEMNLMIRDAVCGNPVTWRRIYRPDVIHSPIHVTDIARVFVRMALEPLPPSRLYNVGGTEALNEAQIVQTILDAAPGHGPLIEADPVDYLIAYQTVDCSRLYRETGFHQALGLADAVRWAARYYTDSAFRAEIDGAR